jgi:hypothetical protein
VLSPVSAKGGEAMKSGCVSQNEISGRLRGEAEILSAWAANWLWHRHALHHATIVIGTGCSWCGRLCFASREKSTIHNDIIYCGCSCFSSSSSSFSSSISAVSDYENEDDDEDDYPQIIMSSCVG